MGSEATKRLSHGGCAPLTDQPFTPPTTMPRMKYFWKNG